MKTISLVLIVLLTGCASRTWTETTDVSRPTGPRKEVIEDRPRAGEFFELRTDVEPDGFTHYDTYFADEAGRIDIELLAPALQCLHYGHAIKLELFTVEDQQVVYTRSLDDAAARDAIRECSVQARLGTTMRLRQAAADILDRLIEATGDAPLREQLDLIRVKVQLRPSWE